MSYMDVANSNVLYFLCGLIIFMVVLQSILFIYLSVKRARELEITEEVTKKVIINSAVFSVLPSLPIIVMLLALSIQLGRYFPWLRLSIVGSAAYEGMAAGIAAKAMGLDNINQSTPEDYIVIMLVMTIGIIWGILFNIFFMKKLDKMSKQAKEKKNEFMPIFTASLFCGMLATISMPYVGNTKNMTSIVSFLVAGCSVILLNQIAKATKVKSMSEFSLPIALIIGMAAAVVYTNIC